MDFAISLYLGGKVISANDENLNNQSYKELGLYCPECGEEVHLRDGYITEPYFAHFKQVADTQCSLRVKHSGNNLGSWIQLEEGKDQRRLLFQQHFLNIITSNDLKFFEKIGLIVARIEPKLLESITQDCIKSFVLNNTKIIQETFIESGNSNINFDNLQDRIKIEAIKYLRVKSSSNILKQIFIYCIYDYDSLSENHFLNKNVITDALNDKAIKLILSIDWIKEICTLKRQTILHKRQNKSYDSANKLYIKSMPYKLDIINSSCRLTSLTDLNDSFIVGCVLPNYDKDLGIVTFSLDLQNNPTFITDEELTFKINKELAAMSIKGEQLPQCLPFILTKNRGYVYGNKALKLLAKLNVDCRNMREGEKHYTNKTVTTQDDDLVIAWSSTESIRMFSHIKRQLHRQEQREKAIARNGNKEKNKKDLTKKKITFDVL